MPRNIDLANDLLASFKQSRVTIQTNKVKSSREIKRGFNEEEHKTRKKTPTHDYYGRYKIKFENGEFDKFSTRDIMYFFKDKANESGVKYIVAKPQIDMRNFKLCIDRGYTVQEILIMIEFLFESDQSYLAKNTLHPGILLTGWANRIYQDSQLWLDDKFVDQKKKKVASREWSENVDTTTTVAKIGEWE